MEHPTVYLVTIHMSRTRNGKIEWSDRDRFIASTSSIAMEKGEEYVKDFFKTHKNDETLTFDCFYTVESKKVY